MHRSGLIFYKHNFSHNYPLYNYLKNPTMIARYRHRYTVTATDMDAEYLLTPNAMLMYSQDCFARMMTTCGVAAFDVVKSGKQSNNKQL